MSRRARFRRERIAEALTCWQCRTLKAKADVQLLSLFIVNERTGILYAPAGPVAELGVYENHLQQWIPGAELRGEPAVSPFTAMLSARLNGKTQRYLLVEKRHFRHQDAALICGFRKF